MIRVVVLLAITVACQTREVPPDPPVTGKEAAPPETPVTPPLAPDADSASVQEHMRAHFAAVVDVQRAITRGHLDRAHEAAKRILTHEEPAIEGGAPFVAEMKRAAEAVIAAKDLPTAGTSAAVLGYTCSRCHEATNAVIAFAWEPQPEPDGSLRVQMQRHQWAAARLWEGLVGPSDEMWSQGSEALATAELDALAAGRGVARGDVQALASHVRDLAKSARSTALGAERQKLYGDLLSTCAGCHQLVRPAPVGP
ncbi:MAG: hypothetical protein ACKV2T_03415 [Kofleriaceae bacterium]